MSETSRPAFTNEKRNRCYGKRVGDIVRQTVFGIVTEGEVIAISAMDNNSISVKSEKYGVETLVAEWCEIITKVEDRSDFSA